MHIEHNMHMERLLSRLLGDDALGIRIEVYDGTELGPERSATVARIVSPDFFHRIVTGRASELAFGRAYVAGDVEIEGDIYAVLGLRERLGKITLDSELLADAAAVLGIHTVRDLARLRPLPVPPEEAKSRGYLHSHGRDARSISSHYDVSNDFFALFLGKTMTYSCAVYQDSNDSIDQAQINKYDLICRKLGLRPGMRLLDVGCGWGAMVVHAVRHYGVDAVGVTISAEQQEFAEKRVADGGMANHAQIRLQDYRDIDDAPFDAISSIGMFEHVGEKRLGTYFDGLQRLLVPGGRLLNHAINRSVAQPSARVDPDGFVGRFIFPDGELLEAGQVVSAISRSGLEVRHLESLREHYGLTLREWVRRLEANWDEALEITSPGRAKAWRLYMAGSAVGFESGEFNLTQILATKSTEGRSGLALREIW
ncbi:MAG: class I SAM-dependent methyltransferase [Acidimicrobiales bacterium]